MKLADVIAELRNWNQSVPVPARLPTHAEVDATERQIGLQFPADYRVFLLEASDVVFGTLEPATVSDPKYHTHLLKVVESARIYGVPETLLPICEDNADFYCFEPSGSIVYWSHNGVTDEKWSSLAHWIEDVWLAPRT